MRSMFSGYYRPKEEDFSANFGSCIFSFDTNVLLNLYRFTPDSRDELLRVLQHDKIKDRVWLSHQAGYEYHDNRIDVIIGQREMYGTLKKAVDESLALINKHRRSGSFHITNLIEPICKGLEQVRTDLEKKQSEHPNLLRADPILDTLTALFDGKIGEPYDGEEYKKKIAYAKQRFESKQPPGYLDNEGRKKKEGDRKYGDVLLWFQLLDFAKGHKKPIILITDETGADWWLKDERKTLGPRPELLQEMHKDAGCWFYMYSTEQFLEYSKDLLRLDVGAKLIKEAKEIKQEDEAADLSNLNLGAALAAFESSRQSLPNMGPLLAALESSRQTLPNMGPLLAALESSRQTLPNMGPLLAGLESSRQTMPDMGPLLAVIESSRQTMPNMGPLLAVIESSRQTLPNISPLSGYFGRLQQTEKKNSENQPSEKEPDPAQAEDQIEPRPKSEG